MPGYDHEADHDDGPKVSLIYRADSSEVVVPAPSYELAEQWEREFSEDGDDAPPWRPSIHMPRWASRITLEITGVWVERLQDISEAHAEAEGCSPSWLDADDNETVRANLMPTYRQGFARLWHEINDAGSWDANPWVWVIEFKRVEPAHG